MSLWRESNWATTEGVPGAGDSEQEKVPQGTTGRCCAPGMCWRCHSAGPGSSLPASHSLSPAGCSSAAFWDPAERQRAHTCELSNCHWLTRKYHDTECSALLTPTPHRLAFFVIPSPVLYGSLLRASCTSESLSEGEVLYLVASENCAGRNVSADSWADGAAVTASSCCLPWEVVLLPRRRLVLTKVCYLLCVELVPLTCHAFDQATCVIEAWLSLLVQLDQLNETGNLQELLSYIIMIRK